MKRLNSRYTVWHWFGMISAFTILIFLSLMGYRYLENSKGPKLDAKGEYHNFTLLPYINYHLDKKEMIFQVDTLKQMLEKDDSQIPGQILDYTFYTFTKAYSNYLKKYKTLWIFELDNTGSEVVADIFIELPGKGKFLINQTGLESEYADFNKRIAVGDLMEGDDATVLAWTEESLPDYTAYYGNETKITTKNGVIDIIYPVKASGLIAWNIEKDNYPLILAMAALFITIMVLVVVFYSIGLRHSKD